VSARHGNADDPDGRTSHYFKLAPHEPNCKYDLDQRGKHLVDGSAGTVVRRAGQWRLICPTLDQLGAGSPANPPTGGPDGPGRTGGSGPRPTSKQAGQAIASARRIVQILQDFGQDPVVASEFAAVAPNGRRNIEWPEFCRGRADADQLAQALLDGTADSIPHAVWGPANDAGAASRNRDTYVVMYVARNPVRIEDKPVRLRVAVRCDRPDWIGATTRSGQFLGYGFWQIFPEDPARAQHQGWVELQLWVKQPWQVARWDTDGTTVALPAPKPATRSPRPPSTRASGRRAGPARPAPSPSPSPSRSVPPAPQPAPAPPAASATPPEPPAFEQQVASHPSPDAPIEPVQEAGPPPEGPPLPKPPLLPPVPPLPPFPPPGREEGGPGSALGRWLRSVRRSRRSE
jgi:hypothetical protein